MNIAYGHDLIAVLISLALISAYYLFLHFRIKKDSSYTIHALLNGGRAAWVARMMADHKESILGVQTLRNAIMGSTFFASTAVILIIGALTLTAQSDKLADVWHALNPDGQFDHRLWLFKLLILLIDLLCAFILFAQSIRLLNHVGFMISVSSKVVAPAAVAQMLIHAGLQHRRGMRCYYFAVPMLFWLFGPIFLVLANFGLVVSLYYLDQAPSDEVAMPIHPQ